MTDQDKLDKLMIDMASLQTDIRYIKDSINSFTCLPIKVSLLEDSMVAIKRIIWGIGSIVATSLVLAILALVMI